jgi:hypothetical protein
MRYESFAVKDRLPEAIVIAIEKPLLSFFLQWVSVK